MEDYIVDTVIGRIYERMLQFRGQPIDDFLMSEVRMIIEDEISKIPRFVPFPYVIYASCDPENNKIDISFEKTV